MIASKLKRAGGSAGAVPIAPDGGAASWQAWARHPEFWIAVVLGAVLRLWAPDSSNFLYDQATLMTLARTAVLRHVVPVAGLPSSIHTLNPPINVYLLIPFVLFGTNPLPAVVALALWNVLGVALCYIFALRFFGRRVAAVGTLLFAACPAAVLYSRFLWPQNYLPPLLTLYAMALYVGCVRGQRGMLVPAVALLTLGALLHPAALLLAPALAVAVLLAPHRPRWREYALSVALVALLLAPTILWEAVSGWSDLRLLTPYFSGRAKIDPEVFFRLYEALGAPGLPQTGSVPHAPPRSLAGVVQLLAAPVTNPSLGVSSPYATASPLYIVCGLVALLLFAVGWLALTARVLAPARAVWRGQTAERGWPDRVASVAAAIWQGLRADAAWRGHLLLWLLVTAPLALLIRHSSAIFTHYLIVLYPFAFLLMAFGVLALARGVEWIARRMRVAGRVPIAGAVALVLVAALILGQTAQSLLYTVSIASGRFDARIAGYGYPLGALQAADTRLTRLRQESGATAVFLAESLLESVPMDYMLVREHPGWVGFPDACLVLPPRDAGPALVVAASGSPDARTLAALPNATLLAALPMAGNAPLTVYRVAGALPATLPGETVLAPVRFQGASGDVLRLDAGYIDGKQVRLRWTVLESTSTSTLSLTLRTQVRDVSVTTHIGHVQAFRDCTPTHWQAGDTVFMSLPFPSSWIGTPAGASDAMLVQVEESTSSLAMPVFGSVRLLSSKQASTPWQALASQSLANLLPASGALEDGGVLLSEKNLNL